MYGLMGMGMALIFGNMVYLSQHLYSWLPGVVGALPVDARFLWLDLTQPDPTPFLPVLVGASMWVVQKMTMPTIGASAQQQSTGRMMLYLFPIMFGFMSYTFPAGLPLYWFISNVVTVVMQYFIIGGGGLRPAAVPAGSSAQAAAEERINASEDSESEKQEQRDQLETHLAEKTAQHEQNKAG